MYLRKKCWHRRLKSSLKAVGSKVITKAIQGFRDSTGWRSLQWFSPCTSVWSFPAAVLPNRGRVPASSWASGRPRNCPTGWKLSLWIGLAVLMSLCSACVCQSPWWTCQGTNLEAGDAHISQNWCLKDLQIQMDTTVSVAFRTDYQDFKL